MTTDGAGGADGEGQGVGPELPAALAGNGARVVALVDYFRLHRGGFTTTALSAAAAAAGYSAAEIDAAWARVDLVTDVPSTRGSDNLVVTIATTVGFVAGVALVPGLLASNPTTAPLVGPWLVVLVVGGVLGWMLLKHSNPAVAQGLGCGLLIAVVVPIVLFLVLLGACLALGVRPI
jgi:hypothetical protein